MPSVSSEIIEDITNHISKCGGNFAEWCVGTARDWHSPVLEAHEREDHDDDLICREAYTPTSARSVRSHFVNDCRMTQINGDGEDAAATARDDGKLVFAFRKSPAGLANAHDCEPHRVLTHDCEQTNP